MKSTSGISYSRFPVPEKDKLLTKTKQSKE